MRFQSNKSSCGPAALHNALSALGIARTEDELIRLTGQRPPGTSARGLLKAIKSVSSDDNPLMGECVVWRTVGAAQVGLWYYISERGRPAILCVDSFDHWVCCVGHLGTRFGVVDSADNRMLIYYTAAELARRWEGPSGGYHAIIV